MNIEFNPSLNARLYIKNPQTTILGKRIIKEAITMLAQAGYEKFTFNKLATAAGTTEAAVYRYFANKHKLLLYLLNWYWSYLDIRIAFHLRDIKDSSEKIRRLIHILVGNDHPEVQFGEFDNKSLYLVAVHEGNKTYFSKEVDADNKHSLYKPFQDLAGRIAKVFQEYGPGYHFPVSLAGSVILLSHFQYFSLHHLPFLSDFSKKKGPKDRKSFLEDLVFNTLR